MSTIRKRYLPQRSSPAQCQQQKCWLHKDVSQHSLAVDNKDLSLRTEVSRILHLMFLFVCLKLSEAVYLNTETG